MKSSIFPGNDDKGNSTQPPQVPSSLPGIRRKLLYIAVPAGATLVPLVVGILVIDSRGVSQGPFIAILQSRVPDGVQAFQLTIGSPPVPLVGVLLHAVPIGDPPVPRVFVRLNTPTVPIVAISIHDVRSDTLGIIFLGVPEGVALTTATAIPQATSRRAVSN